MHEIGEDPQQARAGWFGVQMDDSGGFESCYGSEDPPSLRRAHPLGH